MWKYVPRVTLRKAMVLVALAAGVFAMINAVSESGEAAHRSECTNNLKQIGLGLHNYHSANEVLPPGTVQGTNLLPEERLGWMFVIIPYVEQTRGQLEFDKNSSWDSSANLSPQWVGFDDDRKPFRQTISLEWWALFRCPSTGSKSTPGKVGITHLTGIAGLGLDAPTLPQGHPRAGIFGYDRATKFSDITDGLANTMIVAETIHNNGPWTAGGPITVRGLDPSKPPYIGGKKGQFGGTHPGGANVLFADGSVRFVRQTIAPKTFEALSTISGGEPTPGLAAAVE
jgi:prepilin-type processing-associated H-X9-DG protein